MAIRDTSRKPYIEDNDTRIFIGLDLPIRKSEGKEGYFASTSTTIEAVKNNIRNLLNTHQGERLMQPNLGINLRKFLFQQIDEQSIMSIQNEILDLFEYWLPFVEVRNIEVLTSETDLTVGVNKLNINIIFNIKKDPTTLDSVQIIIQSDDVQTDVSTGASGAGTGGGY